LGRYYRRGRVEQRALRLLRIRTPSVHQDDTVQIERAAQLGSVRGLIGEGLAALSDEQREALQLRVVDELPYVEVARQLGVSEATARARVSRGLRALSVALEPVLASEGWEL